MADAVENGAELQAHQATFAGFTSLMKWGTLGVAIVAALVVFLIAS